MSSKFYKDINPEDVFLDSANLPGFENSRFEGRIEEPLRHSSFTILRAFLVIIFLVFLGRLGILALKDGAYYARKSENNRLETTVVFANRGVILDRNRIELVTNSTREESKDFAERIYAPISGISHVVGYVKYPQADKNGIYYEPNYRGRDGVERTYDSYLRGKHGMRLKETDVHGQTTSEAVVNRPIDGRELVLSIDAYLTQAIYKAIADLAGRAGFTGGVGVILDVTTGEILAMTSFPEYDKNLLTEGTNTEVISGLLRSHSKPFLNRAIGGLYTPGSILKPIIALAALNEEIISPYKSILSTGEIRVANPYDPEKPSVFKDWKAHGWTDMREALAVSSDTYFYSIGGGWGGQKGLGIALLDQYFEIFGLKEQTGIELSGELGGIIPTPEWKAKQFNGDPWRLGDTYITSIGQFGTQITPLNAARFIATIANGGKILKPSVKFGGADEPVERTINFREDDWQVVREGMRAGVAMSSGTSGGLNVHYVKAAAKTGTAEIGAGKKYVNSWSVGFFPYENPKYAWAVVMERGPASGGIGATSVVRQVFDWMSIYSPEYF